MIFLDQFIVVDGINAKLYMSKHRPHTYMVVIHYSWGVSKVEFSTREEAEHRINQHIKGVIDIDVA